MNFNIEIRKLSNKLKDAYWYIRGILWDKHNIIKVKGIGPTYIDPSEIFHMVIFQIVDDYLSLEINIKTYEERVEFLKRKKVELDEDKEDLCIENTREWYHAYQIMIENVQWYKTIYKLYSYDTNDYYRHLGINIPEIPKYNRVRDKKIGGYKTECLEPEKEFEYKEFLKKSYEADENLRKELKEKIKELVDVHDALWS